MIDPRLELAAARFGKGLLQQCAMFEDDDLPAEIPEDRLKSLPQAFAHHCIKALTVVVDDPPGVAQTVLPALQQGLENVALIHLGIAEQGHHAALGSAGSPAFGAHIVLHQRREQCLRHAEAHRARGEIHVVNILGPRRIGLRAVVAAKPLQLVARLVAKEILNGMEHRACVGLHRHPVLRPEDGKIQRGHDRRQRSGGRLMAADLQFIGLGPKVIGVVDDPGGKPTDFPFEFGQ